MNLLGYITTLVLHCLCLQASATMETTAMTDFFYNSLMQMASTVMTPTTGNMTVAMIDGNNITGDILFDTDNYTYLPYNSNIAASRIEVLLPSSFITVYYGLRVLFSLLAIFGNLLTIIVVARFESLHNSTSYFICSLAVADLMTGIMTSTAVALHVLGIYDPLYIPICRVHITLSLVSTLNNICSILLIAVDRYIFIAHGLRYLVIVTPTRTFLVIGFTWLYFMTEVSVLIGLGKGHMTRMTCKYSLFITEMVYNNILMPRFVVVALVTVGFYTAISCIAYKQGKKIAALNQPYDTYEATTNRQQKRIAKMMIMVLGTYFICYIPHIVISILERVYTDSMAILVLEKITVVIFWTNTWINPIIYAWKSEDFRVAFRKLLGLKANTGAPIDIPLPVVSN